MVIDIHNHLWTRDALPDAWWKMYSTFFSTYIPDSSFSGTPEEIDAGLFEKAFDPDGASCLREMDEAAIDVTVNMPVDVDCAIGAPVKPIEQQNQELSDLARKHPDRYRFFCSIDPRKERALEFVERAVEDWGATGFKLHPNMTGLYPWHETAYPIYGRLQDLGLPVLAHTGPMFEPLEPKFSHPREFDKVLADFPDLTVIGAHMGLMYWRDLVEIAQRRHNLLTDFSAFQHEAGGNLGRFCAVLRRCIDGFGVDRVLFGCDGPVWTMWYTRKWWVDLIKGLPDNAPEGFTFTQDEVDALLYVNAGRILK